MLLVDTNVLVDVLENDPAWADWSVRQLRAQAQVHELTINPVIYAELSLVFESVDALDDAIAKMRLLFQEIPRAALLLAGRAFVTYRRAGGNRSNVLAERMSCATIERQWRSSNRSRAMAGRLTPHSLA